MNTITKVMITGITALLLTACGSSSTGDNTRDAAIEKISNYAQNGEEAPTLQDYLDAGVTGITDIDAVNGVVETLNKEDVDTQPEIQAQADALGVEITGNIPPIAKAGSPKTTVEAGETVKFVSRLSTDPDGEIVKYQWLENGRTIARVPFMWKVYYVPGTYKIKLVVTDNDGATSSDEYTITVTAPVVVAAPPAYDTYFENNTSTPLLDLDTAHIDIDAANAVPSITTITVTINLSHTWVGDLRIYLKSPSGTTINLIDRKGVPDSTFGSSGDDFTNTTFDDTAITAINDGNPPFTGTFIPEEPLANFVGEDPVGTWTLSIEDNAGGDTGTFHSWSMTVQ